MYRNFLSKSPLFQRYTWSRCTYYLRTFGYRQMCNSVNSDLDPGGQEIDKYSPPEQNTSNNDLAGDSLMKVASSKAPVSRVMDRHPEDLYRRYFLTPDQPDNPRLLKVAIIGAPNAGKSTLINSLMGWKVNGVSKRVHTTRQNANTVFTIDNAQIILVDTPGVITRSERKRHHCDGSILADPERSLHEADAVGVLVDAENKWTRNELHRELLKVLHLHEDVPSFLILNKIDTLRNKSYERQQKILLDVTRQLCDGVLGGKAFGKTTIERKKVDEKKKSSKDMYDNLEQKYGKLKRKKKMDLEDMKLSTCDKIDSVTGNKARFREEISNIIKQSNMNANSVENNQKKGAEAVESVEKESTDSMVMESLGNISAERDSETEIVEKDQFSNTVAQIEEVAENENSICSNTNIPDLKISNVMGSEIKNTSESEISDQSNSESLRCEVSKGEIAVEGNIILDEKSERTNFENSYQSEFLARILSEPPLPEFAFTSKPEETIHVVSEMKEAIEAVKDKHGWTGFDEVFLISALDGTGIDNLKDYLVKISRPAHWMYHSSVITDQHPYDIAKMCVTQSLLDNMDSYLPYVMEPEIVSWDIDGHNRLNLYVEIKLANTYEMGLVLSRGGGERMRAISASARQALMDAFQCEVRFKLVFVRKKKR